MKRFSSKTLSSSGSSSSSPRARVRVRVRVRARIRARVRVRVRARVRARVRVRARARVRARVRVRCTSSAVGTPWVHSLGSRLGSRSGSASASASASEVQLPNPTPPTLPRAADGVAARLGEGRSNEAGQLLAGSWAGVTVKGVTLRTHTYKSEICKQQSQPFSL